MAEKNKCCKETKQQGNSCCQEGKTDELKDLLQRVQADFENYRKQTEKRVLEIREMAAQNIILQLLPVIDNFGLALKNTEHQKHQDFIEGIKLIHAQITSLLKDNGVKEIETEGKLFDPYFHEALMKVDSDLPENAIVEEFQKGFILHDQVIRHAKVKISGGMRKDDAKDTSKDTSKEASKDTSKDTSKEVSEGAGPVFKEDKNFETDEKNKDNKKSSMKMGECGDCACEMAKDNQRK